MLKLISLLSLLTVSFALYADDDWRTPATENVMYMQLETGLVVIELAPFMAPKHVAQFKALVKEGFYDGLDFYRVMDGFVAQAGDVSEQKASQHKGPLAAEFTRRLVANSDFMLVQSPDFMAPQSGFLYGFPAGRDPETKEEWLLHCPGTVAMARNNEADSATTDFYITIGQATRHLDRNMSSFGRVIYGMPAVQALQRAELNNSSGVIEDVNKRSKIRWIKSAENVPQAQRINLQIQQQESAAVAQRLDSARTLDNEFFHFKGNGNLDVCYYLLKSRIQTQ
jgi:peptidylprolyl isomerase